MMPTSLPARCARWGTFVLLACSTLAWTQTAKKAASASPPVDPEAFGREEKVALVIGINNYPEESKLGKLEFAVSDADELKKTLEKFDYKVTLLTNERATRVAIRSHLQEMIDQLAPYNGTILFFYSGHGGQVANTSYLATYDSSATDLPGTGVSVDEIRKTLADSRAPRKFVFLDACRDLATSRAKGAPVDLTIQTKFAPLKGLRSLFSTGPKTKSYEDKELEHGVFSYFLIEGLKSQAEPNGLVSFDRLADFVHKGVKDKKPTQEPYVDGPPSGISYVAGSLKSRAAARKALVIGNNEYPKHPLLGAVRDAAAVANKLILLGFQVTARTNLRADDLKSEIASFAATLQSNDEAVIYYSGVGAMVNREATLFGVDATVYQEGVKTRGPMVDRPLELAKAMSAAKLLEPLSPTRKGPTILIFDMCLTRLAGSERLDETKLNLANGMAMFAAGPTQLAKEDDGGGLFTQALLEEMGKPGVLASAMFEDVQKKVDKASGSAQLPHLLHPELAFYFKPDSN